MVDRVLVTFNLFSVLFLTSGILMLIFASAGKQESDAEPTEDNVIQSILYRQIPLDGIIANAAVVFVTFIVALVSYIAPLNRLWLRLHSWLVILSGMFTLILGLIIWFYTLKSRSNIGKIWTDESDEVRSLLQQRFSCCGYDDDTSPAFVLDETCPNAIATAQLGGCIGPVGNYANSFLDRYFTIAFAFVGLDALLLLCTAMMLRQRSELQRYRYIDQKNGW